MLIYHRMKRGTRPDDAPPQPKNMDALITTNFYWSLSAGIAHDRSCQRLLDTISRAGYAATEIRIVPRWFERQLLEEAMNKREAVSNQGLVAPRPEAAYSVAMCPGRMPTSRMKAGSANPGGEPERVATRLISPRLRLRVPNRIL